MDSTTEDERYVPSGERIICIALNSSNTSCGVAIYSDVNDSLILDSLPVSAASIEEMYYNLKQTYNPTSWLVHPKIVANAPLLDAILSSPIDGTSGFYRYSSPKSAAWKPDLGLEMICTRLDVRELRPVSSGAVPGLGADAYHLLSSVLDLQNAEIRSAAGALLGHMLSVGISIVDGYASVSRVLPMECISSMRTDADTLRALGVFVQEIHPNVLKSHGRSKEGLSLFNLLDRTRSQPGKNRLREWLARPFCDVARINQRLDGVALFARTTSLEWASGLSKHLRKIRDVSSLLTRVKKAEAHTQDWVALLASCENLLAVADCVLVFISQSPPTLAPTTPGEQAVQADRLTVGEQERACDAAFLRNQWQGVQVQLLAENLQTLLSVIDASESVTQGQLVVRNGYDTQLDSLRATYSDLENTLSHTARRILERFPVVDRVGVEYVPQIGFLVSVSREEASTVLSINAAAANLSLGEATPFELIYSAGDTDMYRTAEVRALDEEIGDIRHAVQDRQRDLLVAVEDTLLICEGPWRQIADCAASLDAVMSLGVIARERDFVRPIITEDIVIAIKGGRHPIQELTVDDFVPNDTFLDKNRNVAVVTGPNSSGKSVYLKQVGLLTYMAHVGCFLPCQRAIIGLCDRLLTRVSSVESSGTPQSAFTLDLSQMSRMLKTHTPRSLCLIDEFGKGTTPEDGVALLASTIEYFSDSARRCRSVFVLNFVEVLTPGLLSEATLGRVICFRMAAHFETSEDAGGGAKQDTLDTSAPHVPLFRLEVGISPTALGIDCAAAAGVCEGIVQRAREVQTAVQQRRPLIALKAGKTHAASSAWQTTSNKRLLGYFLQTKDWLDDQCTPDSTLEEMQRLLKLAAQEAAQISVDM